MKQIFKTYQTIITIVLTALVFFALVRGCGEEPEIKTKTITITKTIHDTVTVKEIQKPDTVYIKKVKTVKGDTEIVYLDKKDTTSTPALQYQTKLLSNKASAELKITALGEVLDVSGVITYPEKETVIEVTKIINKSGFYLYGMVPLKTNYIRYEVGGIYQFKNKVGIIGGIEYDNFTNQINPKIGILIKP